MRATITCSACGTVLGVPKAGMPADGLPCNWCGYVNLPRAEPKPEPAAHPAATEAAPTPSVAATRAVDPELGPWSDDESDSLPYRIPPEDVKTRPCGECGKSIDIHAVVCVHCGFDAETKRKAERTYQPIDREWEAGWPFRRRLTVFLIFQVLNAGSLAAFVADEGSLPTSISGVLFAIFLQAFVLGTYDKVRIRRNKKGQTEIAIIWRICFIPLAPKKVNWREREGVAWGHYDSTSAVDWFFLILLLLSCFPLAVLFWWFVVRADRFYAALARDRGYPDY
ncbi:MAG: hypothetical protein J2P46_07545, partial [Zavarzinella sp.]|nr:hypothetical protein [Zavarzinella sp.]